MRHDILGQLNKVYKVTLLQTQALSIGQANEPCIGLTQENSIESSVQDCLSYIPKPYSLC